MAGEERELPAGGRVRTPQDPKRRKPNPRHWGEYLLFRAFALLGQTLPEGWALALGDWGGWLVGEVLGIRRGVVEDQLRQAFPGTDSRWRRGLRRACYRHLGREAVAALRLGRLGPEEIRRRTTVEGLEAFEAAVAVGRGVILVTGHLGNWEIGGAALAARGVPLEVVAQRLRNPLIQEELERNRRRLGMKVILRGDAPREVLRALRSGMVVGILGDQDARKGGIFVDFFGRPASTARGPALFCLRAGAPLFLGVALREGGVGQHYRVVLEPVPFSPSGEVEADIYRWTERYTRLLEEKIRRAPAQYFWLHRRWKTPPAPAAGRRQKGTGNSEDGRAGRG